MAGNIFVALQNNKGLAGDQAFVFNDVDCSAFPWRQ